MCPQKDTLGSNPEENIEVIFKRGKIQAIAVSTIYMFVTLILSLHSTSFL